MKIIALADASSPVADGDDQAVYQRGRSRQCLAPLESRNPFVKIMRARMCPALSLCSKMR